MKRVLARIILSLSLCVTMLLVLGACDKDTNVTYAVMFNLNGGSGTIPDQLIGKGQKATVPDQPDREHYYFTGWSTSQVAFAEFNFAATSINGTTTLYAHWQIITYIVMFEVLSGTAPSDMSVYEHVDSGKSASKPRANPIKSQHYFGGWSSTEDIYTPFNFDTPIKDDITLYAFYIKYGFADELVESFVKPDFYSFLPENINPKFKGTLPTQPNYDTYFIPTNSIPSYGLFAQANAFVNSMVLAEKLVNGANAFYGVQKLSFIQAYQFYIDANPENYTYFDDSILIGESNIRFIIELSGDFYLLSLIAPQFQADLYFNASSKEYGGRIEANGGVVKFDFTATSLKLAVIMAGVLNSQITLTKTGTDITGSVTEFVNSSATSSTVYMESNALHTTFIGNEGEAIEVYDWNGMLLTIKESNKRWFNIRHIGGITNLKRLKSETGGSDFIYINDRTNSSFKAGAVISASDLTKRYDIVFKTTYFWQLAGETYNLVSSEVPMMYVVENFVDSFTSEVLSQNGFGLSITVPTAVESTVTRANTILKNILNEIKDLVTVTTINTYIGDKKVF